MFDMIKHIDTIGIEWWSAREMMVHLGYGNWRTFLKVLDRARTSCRNVGRDVEAHFEEVQDGKLSDVRLSYYATTLCVLNADPRRPRVGKAQGYIVSATIAAEREMKDAVMRN